jgi:hypothetical protein
MPTRAPATIPTTVPALGLLDEVVPLAAGLDKEEGLRLRLCETELKPDNPDAGLDKTCEVTEESAEVDVDVAREDDRVDVAVTITSPVLAAEDVVSITVWVSDVLVAAALE